jgi:branched-chain amino acid transport system substrate-binding protein
MQRRTLVKAVVAALAGAGIAAVAGPVGAQAKEVRVAMIAPMSGPWARQGELMKKGADMAIEDINRAGGVKSMGGARLRLLVVDAGDSAEKAKNAAQRLVAQEADVVGASGAWLSSFTLAVTEVTERAELPVLTLSYSDVITGRGFKYVFQTSPTGGAQANGALPALLELAKQATGQPLKTVGIVMDNTASPVSFVKPMREGGFDKLNLKLVVDETFTPPLADASSVVQKVRNTRPDVLLLLPTSVPDDKLVLEKLSEMGMGRGRLPVVSNGAHMGAPEMLKLVGKDLMEGVMTVVANWGAKGQEKLIADFKKRTGEPWMTQDSISTYGDMWIFKEALEKAKVADRKKVAEAIRTMDTTEGAAKFFPGGRLKFDENGRRAGAALLIVQWQNGEPMVVYPPNAALAKPNWSKAGAK